MRSLILCAEPGPGKNLDIMPEIVQNADFDPNVSQTGLITTNKMYQVIWAQECSLDLLFTRESDPNEEFWKSVWDHLDPGALFTVRGLRKYINVTLQVQDLSRIIRAVSKWFLLVAFQQDAHVFRKILEGADVTTIEELNEAMQTAQPLHELFDMAPDKEICEIAAKFKNQLGEGAQGQVFYHPEWRTDVAIKRIRTQKRIIPEATQPFIPLPKNGAYSVTDGFLEMLSSSLIAELADGTSDKGYSLHIPRFTGFFTCPGNLPGMGTVYDLYIITELMQTDLKAALQKNAKDMKVVKSLIWQALYTLISINAIGWQHHDASTRNFLVSDVKADEIFLNREIGQASRWVHRLNGKSWALRNFRKVVKVADFGFLVHLDDPMITYSDVKYVDVDFRVTNKMKRGADVNYFILTAIENLGPSFAPFYETWWKLIGAPKLENDLYQTLWDVMMTRKPWSEDIEKVINRTFRTTEKYDDWDTIALLDADFFKDVVD